MNYMFSSRLKDATTYLRAAATMFSVLHRVIIHSYSQKPHIGRIKKKVNTVGVLQTLSILLGALVLPTVLTAGSYNSINDEV